MAEPTATQLAGLAIKTVGDATAYGVVFATVLKLLPPLAALISILWIGFQFYHCEPVKNWRERRKGK